MQKLISKFIKIFCVELKSMCSPNEVQQRWLIHNRTLLSGTEVNQQQNRFNRSKYAFWSGPVRVLTSAWLRRCGMTRREQFRPDFPRILQKLKQFVKGLVQNSSWPLQRSGLQLQEMFGWDYCCQRRVNKLLNPRVYILFPPCTVNVFMCVQWKHIILCVVFTQADCFCLLFWVRDILEFIYDQFMLKSRQFQRI